MENLRAQELRIGNFVNNKGRLDIVTCLEYVTFEDITNVRGQYYECFIPEPIPLTEEWLLKFGFKIDKDPETVFYEIRFDKIANYKFYISRKIGFGIFYYETNFSTTQINSVHQLQNLYFAITNEELILVK
jgi:hypothetical protein